MILLVGPAGYGKTTLARQWARTLSGVIWIASTPSHRDVVTFTEDVAAGVDALGGDVSRFMGEYMRARSNPQRAAREIANVLVDRMADAPVHWLVIDDYHELAESPEVEEMFSILRSRMDARILVASRVRPSWATTRDVIYGEIAEIGSSDLALTPDETAEVIGRRPDLDSLVRRAQGWPAVLALAAGLDATSARTQIPSTLHGYVADELFRSASTETQNDPVELGLLPDLTPATLRHRFGANSDHVIERARDLGFLSHEAKVELHPLLRDFLLAKLAEDPLAADRVRSAVDGSLEVHAWDKALDLVLRFALSDLVDPVLQQAFKPLVRSGRVGTLSAFADQIRQVPGFPVASVDLIEAEVALRDGQSELALQLARRVQRQLDEEHPLRSRAYAIAGQAQFFSAAFVEADLAFEIARTCAHDEADELEALHGIAVAKAFGEHDDPLDQVDALIARKHMSPVHLLRATTARLTRRRYYGGLSGDLDLDEPLHAFAQAEDPRARTAFTYASANVLAIRADYRESFRFLDLLRQDADAYALDFLMPFVQWTSGTISLGLRKFGETDRNLQLMEDTATKRGQGVHLLNASMLRARLLLQTGSAEEALQQLTWPSEIHVAPSWRGEFMATKALALACVGRVAQSRNASKEALSASTDTAVHVLALGAIAVCDPTDEIAAAHLMRSASSLSVWDPVVCTLRTSPDLVSTLCKVQENRSLLGALFVRSDDHALARAAGVRTRTTRAPNEVLSPRELEVLGLMARGLRNREIAGALYIAESTVKVHARHILERLGVRSRAEAVAQYERLTNAR